MLHVYLPDKTFSMVSKHNIRNPWEKETTLFVPHCFSVPIAINLKFGKVVQLVSQNLFIIIENILNFIKKKTYTVKIHNNL